MTIDQFISARLAETYPEPRSNGHSIITQEWLPKVVALVPMDAAILDVGCGSGVALELMRDRHGAYGITPNTEEIKLCKSLGLPVYRGEMHSFCRQIAEPTFDLIWARHVLEHSPIPLYVLSEFFRVLKPGGWLYVEVPSPETECRHETNPNHYSVLGHTMWLCLLAKAGLTVEQSHELRIGTEAGPDIYWNFICKKS